jgi:hypothetical protein
MSLQTGNSGAPLACCTVGISDSTNWNFPYFSQLNAANMGVVNPALANNPLMGGMGLGGMGMGMGMGMGGGVNTFGAGTTGMGGSFTGGRVLPNGFAG